MGHSILPGSRLNASTTCYPISAKTNNPLQRPPLVCETPRRAVAMELQCVSARRAGLVALVMPASIFHAATRLFMPVHHLRTSARFRTLYRSPIQHRRLSANPSDIATIGLPYNARMAIAGRRLHLYAPLVSSCDRICGVHNWRMNSHDSRQDPKGTFLREPFVAVVHSSVGFE